jgi:hypothetical protein
VYLTEKILKGKKAVMAMIVARRQALFPSLHSNAFRDNSFSKDELLEVMVVFKVNDELIQAMWSFATNRKVLRLSQIEFRHIILV